VGDPGLGKSQLLLACANVAPRGVFVTATGVTTSGWKLNNGFSVIL